MHLFKILESYSNQPNWGNNFCLSFEEEKILLLFLHFGCWELMKLKNGKIVKLRKYKIGEKKVIPSKRLNCYLKIQTAFERFVYITIDRLLCTIVENYWSCWCAFCFFLLLSQDEVTKQKVLRNSLETRVNSENQRWKWSSTWRQSNHWETVRRRRRKKIKRNEMKMKQIKMTRTTRDEKSCKRIRQKLMALVR